ncbi:hypothetical protein [Conexibacter sp. CPCC 206217]|uniref:hypothetical protein n=1 Tax=Conexibacter sp. CPCC 206217 TaxID=3064574 RepID=UPI002725CDC8|nr:hypothetical protein [Conexibacter sp. CPCC 206217]MDO8209275.1 hypothetical protein [Conexibacter sp. CPCC 206217]
MSRDPLVAELVEQLVAIRFAELVRENRALRARLAAELVRGGPAPLRPASALVKPTPRPRLRLVPSHADGART